MNEGPSSSTTIPIHTPSFDWDDGHPRRLALAHYLQQGQFTANIIVVIDSGFTQAIFGQFTERHDEQRIHHMQTLHVGNFKLDDEDNGVFYQAYEFSKEDLFKCFESLTDAISAANTLAKEMIVFFPENMQIDAGKRALSWCITAYSMVINPLAPIKLVQRPIGTGGERGFGIVAKRFIKEGEYIFELPGMIAKTSAPRLQTRLSLIIPHRRQKQGTKERVLFGPLRFVNHICKGSNVTWEAIDESCAFTTVALTDIKIGEELFADYGSTYFEDLEAGCPCRSCNTESFERHEAEKIKRQEERRNQEEIDRVAIAEKKKERNKRRKEKRKMNTDDI